MKKIIYFTICLLQIGLYLSCGVKDSIDTTTVITKENSDKKEISSFVFFTKDNSYLKEDITMDITGQDITKTVTNVEGITNLIPYIVHNGLNIFPASGIARDFSFNSIYVVTAEDKSTFDYTISLTSYYAVIFNANGGFIMGAPTITEYVLYKSQVNHPSDPSQEHYRFKGWYDTPTGINAFDFSTSITAKTTAYAQWTNKTYTVSFNTDGGSTIDSVTVDSLTTVTKPNDPTTNHYSLEGWYLNNHFTNKYNFNWAVSNDFTLYAKYINKQYTVSFNTDGGSAIDSITVDSLTTVTKPNDPTTNHYSLEGWYINDNLIIEYNFNWKVSNDLTLYAKYTNKQYTVSFNTDGGSAIDSITVDSLTTVTKPNDPTTNHYSLEGWYINDNLIIEYNFNWKVSNDLTLYAKYTNKQYTINFDTDGGSTIASITVNSLTPVTKPINPTIPNEHYSSFEGWYTNNHFTTEYDFNWMVSNDLTLYAKYTHKQYQVRFYQGATLLETISVPSLNAIPVSDYPTPSIARQLYKWYSDTSFTQLYDKNSLITGNLDLYAKGFSTDGSFQSVIENGVIPSDLANYDDISEEIFSRYTAGATVIARYVTISGNGDGSSWANAGGDMQLILNGISDASDNKVYMVLMASGTYKPSDSYVMKNHIALVGGFIVGSYDRIGETRLDGDVSKRVFDNDNNGLDKTALLYGVTITNGNAVYGGGMYNDNSSPTLINVTFSDNIANGNGGGMYNYNSSPTLINVTFSDNIANGNGGGMYNYNSSPTLNKVTFSGNTTGQGGGGGIYNQNSASTLINVTFSDNIANGNGGGMINTDSPSILTNITFSNNIANNSGGGMYNDSSSSTLMNVTFSDNRANDGGGMYNIYSSPTLMNATFSKNTANYNGGGMYNIFFGSPTLINTTFSKNTGYTNGGGMYNYHASSTLINTTFSANTASKGGGLHQAYHQLFSKQQPFLTMINTILWKNNNGNIYVWNDNLEPIEDINLYYSLIEGGANASTSTAGIRLENNNTTANLVNINVVSIIANNPELGTLANNGGMVNSISINSSSSAKDMGIYVKRKASSLYYSPNNTDWFSDPGLNTSDTPPNDAEDLTAIDARGYSRIGRPDMGAYEVGGKP